MTKELQALKAKALQARIADRAQAAVIEKKIATGTLTLRRSGK